MSGSGIQTAVALLRTVGGDESHKMTGKTVVIGGGNVAIDAARVALRCGSSDVTMVCLEPREKMPASAEEIAEAETAAAPAESLQRESGDEGFTLEHVLGDYGQEDRVLESVALRTAIERLSEKEQQVINLRFFHGLTQSDCARILSVSQVQVSRLERRAMENLRAVML